MTAAACFSRWSLFPVGCNCGTETNHCLLSFPVKQHDLQKMQHVLTSAVVFGHSNYVRLYVCTTEFMTVDCRGNDMIDLINIWFCTCLGECGRNISV